MVTLRGRVSMKCTASATSSGYQAARGERLVEVLLRPVLEQRGDDRPGRDRADPDAVFRDLPAQRVDERLNRVLGSGVDRLPDDGQWPATELVTTMSPVPRSIMCGRTAWTVRNTALTFRFSIRSHASGHLEDRRRYRSRLGVEDIELAGLAPGSGHHGGDAPGSVRSTSTARAFGPSSAPRVSGASRPVDRATVRRLREAPGAGEADAGGGAGDRGDLAGEGWSMAVSWYLAGPRRRGIP